MKRQIGDEREGQAAPVGTLRQIFMIHDLTCVFINLIRAAKHCPDSYSAYPTEQPALDLALAAIAFTTQLAIESGHEPAEMRTLERTLADFISTQPEAPRTARSEEAQGSSRVEPGSTIVCIGDDGCVVK